MFRQKCVDKKERLQHCSFIDLYLLNFAMETIEKSENNNMNYQYVIFDAWENRVLFNVKMTYM